MAKQDAMLCKYCEQEMEAYQRELVVHPNYELDWSEFHTWWSCECGAEAETEPTFSAVSPFVEHWTEPPTCEE